MSAASGTLLTFTSCGRLLPQVIAHLVYRGGDDGIVAAWESLVRWIDDSGYRLVGDCRELYHEWHDEDPALNVMELQQPIAR